MIDHLRWGVYQLELSDSNGCLLQDTVHINPGICCDEVFIPNAFSPNQDNLNDCWRVVTAAGMELRQLAIFNRWGNKLWSANDVQDCWDGSYNSKRCDVGTYYYIFRYKCLSDGKEYVKKGDISLLE
jgi:gliding motility-associated-like protein